MSKAARNILVGLEGVARVPATVDRALYGAMELEAVVEKDVPEEDVSSYTNVRHDIGAQHAEGTYKQPDALYDEAPYSLAMAMGNPGAPGGAPGAYVWTFPLPYQRADLLTPATFTIEYTDDADWTTRGVGMIATSLKITGAHKKFWDFEAKLQGANCDYPASPSAVVTISGATDSIRMADTTLYIDDLYANIGTTTISGFYDFTWELTGLMHQKEHAGSLSPNDVGFDRYTATLGVTVECNSEATALALRDHLLDTDVVAVRIEAIRGAREARIDHMYMVNKVSTLKDIDRDNVVEIELKSQKDSLDNTGEVEVVCTLAAL